MADQNKKNAAVKKPTVKRANPAEPNEKEVPLSGETKSQEPNIEQTYPGVTEQISRFEEAKLPSCPHCGSDYTARVQVGIIGRAITIAASTRKVKLVPNVKDRLGQFFCNECKKFFN
jgi:hypothetical protein